MEMRTPSSGQSCLASFAVKLKDLTDISLLPHPRGPPKGKAIGLSLLEAPGNYGEAHKEHEVAVNLGEVKGKKKTSSAGSKTAENLKSEVTMESSRKVIAVLGPGRAELVDRPLPVVRDRFMLVKPVAIALNPTDWKHVDAGLVGAVVGCDYAGIVEAIGKGVRKKFKKGDKVYGVVHGCNRQELDDGAFGNYILVKADVQSHMPDNLSFEEAATLGVGIITVCQGLYLGLGLDLPTSPSFRRTPVLIYGGSTATGSLGIQFAKLSGFAPIAVCSPRNFEFVKSLGAVAAFDYHDLDCGLKIREFTGNKLKLAWDTISLPVSARICAHALSTSSGGRYFALLPEPCPRDDVESSYTMAYYMFGEKVQMSENGPVIPPDHSGFRFAKEFVSMANQLLADGKIKVHPQQVCGRGLAGALEGLQTMRDGKVTRSKLVYRVAETPGLEPPELS